ncbi:ATP-binding protein, partial [Alienimonas sp. DA493]|uniref:AAA family ATPase n=1 Tax=Alienimonas sp. DA493 TaxID=3373605 RepID=UPI0037547998
MPRRPQGPSPPELDENEAAPGTPPGMTERLSELIAAAFPGVLAVTPEPEEVLHDLAGLCRERGWNLATWTADGGEDGPADPLAAVQALPASGDGETPSLLAMVHVHRYFQSPELLAAVRSALAAGKIRRTCLVLVQPSSDLPPELSRDFAVLDCPLPSRQELEAVARGVATEEGELPDPLTPVLDAAAGLTRSEAENAFALSLVRHGRLDPGPLWELKAKQLAAGGPLTLHRGGPGFNALGGMAALKAFCRTALRNGSTTAEAKGVLLLGPGGVGKSTFARALGAEVGRPTLTLDVGALMGGLVGATEENTRRALATIEAMAPVICFVDEIERVLAGTSGGAHDSGVSSRLLGTLLSWLADRPPGVFVVCTANDASRLPPELTRSGRFDATFFLDLPGEEQRRGIWETYRERYGIAAGESTPADAGWTGAEIESCCRLSALLGVPLAEAATHV